MLLMRPLGAALVLSGVVGALAGDGGCAPTPLSSVARSDGPAASTAELDYIETGDLRQIKERGRLRVLIHHSESPSSRTAARDERLVRLSRDLGLEVEWIAASSWDDLVPALLAGEGDLVASELTVTPELRDQVDFAFPLSSSRWQVIVRADETSVARPADLVGTEVALWPGSEAWGSMLWLQERHPGLELVAASQHESADELVAGVLAGTWDAAVVPNHLLSQPVGDADEARVAFNLTPERAVAWAVRPDSPLLLAAIDRHLSHALERSAQVGQGSRDLAQIQERGVLRVLTRADPTTAYLRGGRLTGFEHDLIEGFAAKLGVEIEVIVPPARADLLQWLADGRGDVVAARMAIPEDADEPGELAWTRPYNFVSLQVIGRASEGSIEDPEALEGRQIAVPEGGPAWRYLELLAADEDLEFELVPVPTDMPADEVMARVADGTWDLTVVDSHLADAVLPWRDDLVAGAALTEVAHGWAVRAGSGALCAELDSYLDSVYRSAFYNITWSRYFKHGRAAPQWLQQGNTGPQRLSPFDGVARVWADAFGFDWRLVVAQMYQESKFRPLARSERGAEGLMQLLPRTMQELGIEARGTDSSIQAGVTYLARMREWLAPEIQGQERTWFALAAYNVGIGHVEDARALAVELGLDPNRWFGQTEIAMLKLTNRAHARKARYGYCDGQQAANYVRAVQNRYVTYLRLARAPETGVAFLRDHSPTPTPVSLASLR